MLGGEQSGHIAGVGFDLYLRMVGDAVEAYKRGVGLGEDEEAAEPDLKVELPIDANIPEEYLPHERLRLEAYAKMAAAKSDSDVDDA